MISFFPLHTSLVCPLAPSMYIPCTSIHFLFNYHCTFLLDSHPLTFYPFLLVFLLICLLFCLLIFSIFLLLLLLLLLLHFYTRFEYNEVFTLTLASRNGNQDVAPSVFMITIRDDDSESGRMYSCGGVVWCGGG